MNILLNGYFDKNFGDDAMQEIVVKSFPECDFYINCNQKEMLRHLEKYENVHIGTKLPQIDIFLNVIGTGFLYKTRFAKVTKMFEVFFKKKTKYPRMALVDCSVEHFTSRVEKWLVKKSMSEYDLITCRDDVSYTFLKRNIKKSDIYKFNDIVFSGGYIKQSEKKYLGIVPVNRYKNEKNYAYYKELASFADNYIETENKAVKLFAFDAGNENDILAVMSIMNMMKHKDKVLPVVYNSDIEGFVNEFSECDKIVGSRFHSIILALINGIDTIAIYDTEKMHRICNDFGIMSIKKEEFTSNYLMECVNHYKESPIDASDSKGHIEVLKKFIMG